MELRKMGFGYKQIAKTIKNDHGISLNPGMICNWVKGRHHPLGRCNKLIEGPELSYVIGGWIGDGYLRLDRRNYRHYVTLAVSDLDFAIEWGKKLAIASGKKDSYKPRWNEKLQRWVVQGSNKLLYLLLKKTRKNPWIIMPILKKYPEHALRGFFDAEGSVDLSRYCVRAFNTCIETIEIIRKLIEEIDIEEYRIYGRRMRKYFTRNGKTYKRNKLIEWSIEIYRKENIEKFAKVVGFTIERKRQLLERLLNSYRS